MKSEFYGFHGTAKLCPSGNSYTDFQCHSATTFLPNNFAYKLSTPHFTGPEIRLSFYCSFGTCRLPRRTSNLTRPKASILK